MSEMVIGDDGFLEIVGEQLRGGSTVAGLDPHSAYEVMGEMIQKSAPFAAYVQKRVAASRPVIHRTPLNKARDWQIDFTGEYGVHGTAGSSTTLVVNPQCLFRGEKIMATDSSATRGYGTAVSQIFVGQKSQRPANSGATLTAFFAQNALGNGVKWDTCQKGLLIAMTVNFIEDCTFYCTVYGKSVC